MASLTSIKTYRNLQVLSNLIIPEDTPIKVFQGNIQYQDENGEWNIIPNKTYVDAIASGIIIKASCDLATNTSLPSNTYDQTFMTLRAIGNGALIIDGVMVSLGNRILVKNEAIEENNGIYEVSQVGDSGTPWILTRTEDANNTNELKRGVLVGVLGGTTNANTLWVLITDIINLGTDPVTFTQFLGKYQAGNNLVLNGNTFSVTNEPVFDSITTNLIKGTSLITVNDGFILKNTDSTNSRLYISSSSSVIGRNYIMIGTDDSFGSSGELWFTKITDVSNPLMILSSVTGTAQIRNISVTNNTTINGSMKIPNLTNAILGTDGNGNVIGLPTNLVASYTPTNIVADGKINNFTFYPNMYVRNGNHVIVHLSFQFTINATGIFSAQITIPVPLQGYSWTIDSFQFPAPSGVLNVYDTSINDNKVPIGTCSVTGSNQNFMLRWSINTSTSDTKQISGIISYSITNS